MGLKAAMRSEEGGLARGMKRLLAKRGSREARSQECCQTYVRL